MACGSRSPAATGVQLPTWPGTLHDWQAAPHDMLQHTPSPQKPVAHSRGDEQGNRRSVKHKPLLHVPVAQSVSFMQKLRHAGCVSSQEKGAQDSTRRGVQAPLPSHVDGSRRDTPEHIAGAQIVPWYNLQAPAPLHWPSCPQLAAP
jgi:hypothetical protein